MGYSYLGVTLDVLIKTQSSKRSVHDQHPRKAESHREGCPLCHSSWEETMDGRRQRGRGERGSIITRVGEEKQRQTEGNKPHREKKTQVMEEGKGM